MHGTRSLPGARAVLAVLALACTHPVTAARAGGEGPEGLGSLPWGVGGRVGFTVDAACFPDSEGYSLEVYVRIPPSTLDTLSRDSTGTVRVRISLDLHSGGARQEREQTFTLESGKAVRGFGKVALFRLGARSGRQKLKVRMEDLESRRRGLLYTGRQVPYSEELEGEFQLPRPQMGRDLSDLEFVWSEDSLATSTAFQRADRNLIPNPERLYGLFASDLRAAFVARARAGDLRSWHWVARILDPEDHVMAERESTGATGRWLTGSFVLDVSTLPAGGYDLEVKAWQDGDPGALMRRARFSIAWRRDSWLRDSRDVEDEIHLLLDAQSEDAFVQLQPGVQECNTVEFGRVRDPSPGTAENEARDAFLQRVARANQIYSRLGLGKGMLSDMGRVYIRYGEPSETLHQVIPTGDETLTQAIQQLSLTEDRPIGEVGQKGPGGDQRPFEVWIYEGDIPRPVDADPRTPEHTRHHRLVFLFVDEQGLGQYTLRYSTE